MAMLAGGGQRAVYIQCSVHGLGGHVDPAMSVQRVPDDLIALRVRGIVEVLQRGHLATCESPLCQERFESATYDDMSPLQDVDRRVGQVDVRSEEHTSELQSPLN